MEHLPFILMTALAALACFFIHRLEQSLNEERSNHRVIRERESIASRMLFGYCRKLLLDTDTKYIDKDEVVNQLVAILNIQGYDVPTKEAKTKEEASDP